MEINDFLRANVRFIRNDTTEHENIQINSSQPWKHATNDNLFVDNDSVVHIFILIWKNVNMHKITFYFHILNFIQCMSVCKHTHTHTNSNSIKTDEQLFLIGFVHEQY